MKRKQRQQADSFERFYLDRIAIGEAWACAELQIRNRELDDTGHSQGGSLGQQASSRPNAGYKMPLGWRIRAFLSQRLRRA